MISVPLRIEQKAYKMDFLPWQIKVLPDGDFFQCIQQFSHHVCALIDKKQYYFVIFEVIINTFISCVLAVREALLKIYNISAVRT